MTIKELAEFTGKSDRTVRRWVNKASDKMSSLSDKMSNAEITKTPSDFTIDEIEQILLSSSMSKDAVTILIHNARDNNKKAIANLETNNNPMTVMMDFMVKMQEQQQQFMNTIVDRLDNVEKAKTLQLDHVPDMPSRTLFRKLIDELVSIAKVDHSTAYNRVYSEMGYLYGVKIKARAKNSNIKPIDVLERDDLMGKAVAVTRQFLKTVKDRNEVS